MVSITRSVVAIMSADIVSGGVYVPRAGLTSIKTRRSACDSGTSFPERSRFGRMDLYFHRHGTVVGLGAGGFNRAICFQSGRVLLVSRSASSCSSESIAVATSVVDMISISEQCQFEIDVFWYSFMFGSDAEYYTGGFIEASDT